VLDIVGGPAGVGVLGISDTSPLRLAIYMHHRVVSLDNNACVRFLLELVLGDASSYCQLCTPVL
jgi:hypothetical protein